MDSFYDAVEVLPSEPPSDTDDDAGTAGNANAAAASLSQQLNASCRVEAAWSRDLGLLKEEAPVPFSSTDVQAYSLRQPVGKLKFAENTKKEVFLQEANGNKVKPSRPRISKATKQPNVGKIVQECRTAKANYLDLSGNELTQAPNLKGLHHIHFLMLYENKLTELPKGIGEMNALEHLIAHGNHLQANGILEEFSRCANVKVIDLRKNRLEQLPSRPLFELPKLEHLFASFNKLTRLPVELGNAKSLTVLILSHNSLRSSIPASVGQLQALQTLDLSYNNLESLPSEIGQCESLRSLMLHHNHLISLPETIGQLRNLSKLTLKYNQLRSLPASLALCTQLTEFNIESNKITELPDFLLLHFPNLKSVTLSRNEFNKFPSGGPAQFSTVTSISMDHNHLDGIPIGIFSSAKNLLKLKLTDNEICSLIPSDLTLHWHTMVEVDLGSNRLQSLPPEIKNLQKVEVLRLPHNQLRVLPPEMCTLSSLRLLDVESNQLDCLPNEMNGWIQLTELNVSSNNLITFPATIGEMDNLRIIRAGDNKIRSLPPEIGKMKSLYDLYLNDNDELDNIPIELSCCSTLHILNLERCPLSDLPNQVVNGGSAMIIYFLQQVLLFRASRSSA